MWSLLTRRSQVLILVTITTVCLVGIQAASELWAGVTLSLFKSISIVATAIGSVFVLIANSVWRWIWKKFPILNSTVFPDLNGQWEGSFQSTWLNPVSGHPLGPISSKVTIRQNILSISVKQRTAESTSWSTQLIASANAEADIYRIWYSYSNKVAAAISHRSCDHDGVA